MSVWPELRGRDSECEVLSNLVKDARVGRLLRTGDAAEDCYHEAIERLQHTTKHARAQLRCE